MRQTTDTFRSRYRADIHPRYNPWLHGTFVLLFGGLAIGGFWSTVHQVQPLEWLAVPIALLFFNFGVYMVHRHLGHHKKSFARMFYARHAGDHHSFFTPGHMTYDSARDWRVILFPAWLIVVHTVVFTLPLWWLVSQLNANVAGLLSGCLVLVTSCMKCSMPANICLHATRSHACRGFARCAVCTNCIIVARSCRNAISISFFR